MFFKKIFLSLLTAAFFLSSSYALEIPLSGAVKRNDEAARGIVFVDMERVFDSHPMAERLKNEMKNFAKTRKDAIEEMIKQHDVLQAQIKEIGIKIIEAQEAENSEELAELAGKLDSVQKSVEEQKAKIGDLSKRTRNELALMEEKNSLAVLKDIDIILKEISKKRGSEIMLDKQSVLCGSDQCEDVTDEVIKRLEGR